MLGRFTVCFVTILFLGCGSGRPPLGRVTGTVTFDGKPLASGTITFETQGRRPATGRIEKGQIVEMTTYDTGDGVPVGSHKVAIWAMEEAGSAIVANPGEGKMPDMSGKSLIPAKYNDPNTSQLTAEIKSGENVVSFQLKKN